MAGSTNYALPSRGLFYGTAAPQGAVQVHPWAVENEEDFVASDGDIMSRIDSIVQKCVVLPSGLVFDDLLMGDKLALLIVQRSLTYTPLYHMEWGCKYCQAANKCVVDMTKEFSERTPLDVEAKVKEQYPHMVDFKMEEPFFYTLPSTKTKVGLRCLRVKHERQLLDRKNQLSMRETPKPEIEKAVYRMKTALQIDTLNGKPVQPGESEVYMRGHPLSMNPELRDVPPLNSMDSLSLRNFLGVAEPTIDTGVSRVCSSCRQSQRVAIQFSMEFFRPSRV